MRRFSALLVLALLPVLVFSAKVEFKKIRLEEAVSLAKQQDKNIFIDFMATWCGPCKWMDKQVFTDPKVAEYMNANFINLKIDVESELGESKAYTAFNIQAMPTLIFLTKEGELAYRQLGAQDATDFLALAKKANNPAHQLTPLLKTYDSEKPAANSKNMLNLLATLEAAQHERYVPIWKAWRKSLQQAQYVKDGTLQALFVPMLAFDSPEVAYLKTHSTEAQANIEESVLTRTLMTYVQPHFQKAVVSNDKTKLDGLLEFVGAVAAKDKAPALQLQFELIYYQMTQDFEGLALVAAEKVPEAGEISRDLLNNFAWNIYQNVDKKALLLKTADWFHKQVAGGLDANAMAKNSIDDKAEAQSVYMYYDTYAALLLKAGAPNAVEVTRATIAFANANGLNATGTEDLLEQYK